MAGVKDFYLGARPKTLSATVSPVIIAIALAATYPPEQLASIYGTSTVYNNASESVSIACLIVALALQIGVNYANDYSDGIKGTDKDRVGPMRLVGSGKASPRSVLIAMFVSFFVAGVAGIYVASQSSWWLIGVGAICIALAWFYTGSSKPYGYYGYGELVVFICFGLVATIGSYYANTLYISKEVVVASFIPGFFAVAILLTNNIRDIATDIESGKKTLAVRIGESKSKKLYVLCSIFIGVCVVVLGVMIPYVFVVLLLSPLVILLNKKLMNAKTPIQYIEVLGTTSRLGFIVALSIVASVFVSGL